MKWIGSKDKTLVLKKVLNYQLLLPGSNPKREGAEMSYREFHCSGYFWVTFDKLSRSGYSWAGQDILQPLWIFLSRPGYCQDLTSPPLLSKFDPRSRKWEIISGEERSLSKHRKSPPMRHQLQETQTRAAKKTHICDNCSSTPSSNSFSWAL